MNPVTVALAVQRLTQLITEDELTRPVRDGLDQWSAGAADLSFKERIATLVQCPACTSVWAAAGILLVARFRVGRVLVRILAASSAALIVNSGIKRVER